MKTQLEISDAIRAAAFEERETWRELCQAIYNGDARAARVKEKWRSARDELADALELRGDERVRAHLLYRALCARNGVPAFEFNVHALSDSKLKRLLQHAPEGSVLRAMVRVELQWRELQRLNNKLDADALRGDEDESEEPWGNKIEES